MRGLTCTTIIVHSSITIATRVKELAMDIKTLKSSGFRARQIGFEASTTTLSTLMTLFWTIVCVTCMRHRFDKDILIPASSLLFLFTKRNVFITDAHPLVVSGFVSCCWWILSAVYDILLKGNSSMWVFHGLENSNGIFSDADVSIWTNDNLVYPFLNLFLMCIPLPG